MLDRAIAIEAIGKAIEGLRFEFGTETQIEIRDLIAELLTPSRVAISAQLQFSVYFSNRISQSALVSRSSALRTSSARSVAITMESGSVADWHNASRCSATSAYPFCFFSFRPRLRRYSSACRKAT